MAKQHIEVVNLVFYAKSTFTVISGWLHIEHITIIIIMQRWYIVWEQS